MDKKIPVGKIDFLDTNGEVGETCYYYTEEEFLKSVKHENYYGAPMVVTVFRDDNGQTIPLDFMKDFDPYPQGFHIIDYEEGDNLNEFQKLERLAKQYKALYPQGTRIELVMMGSDPRPIEPGTRGTVDHVDDLGTIHCTFDNGRRLGIIPEEDSFRVLTQDEVLEEKSIQLQDAYVDKINKEVIPRIEWVGMKNAYKYGNMDVPTDLLRMLHEKFVEVYGSDHIDRSLGFVQVPGLTKVADGSIYPALLTIDTESSGEHWGTTFFTPNGILNDTTEDEDMLNEIRTFIPYQYWYTPELVTDHHVDWDNCPEEVLVMLDNAIDSEQESEVKLE